MQACSPPLILWSLISATRAVPAVAGRHEPSGPVTEHRASELEYRPRRDNVIASFQRAAVGVAALCLFAAVLIAPLGGFGSAAAEAEILPGDEACIPVK